MIMKLARVPCTAMSAPPLRYGPATVAAGMSTFCNCRDRAHDFWDHTHSCWLALGHEGAHVCRCYWVWAA